MLSRWAVLTVLLLLPLSIRADGPHWHLPNPDGEDSSDEDDRGGDPDAGDEELKGKTNIWDNVADFDRNPGSFVMLDVKAREYYSRHCGVPAVSADKTKIYLRIIHRAAQVMREVDTYVPCQDAYPLWHSERRRERMVKYAIRTWARVRELAPESARPCAELAVDCYVDSVRFAGESRETEGSLKQFFKVHREIRNMSLSLSTPRDRARAGRYYVLLAEMQKMLPQVTKSFKTFGQLPSSTTGVPMGWQALLLSAMTGDIPVQIDDTENRMREALLKMGQVALGPLLKYTKHANPQVAHAASSLYALIAGQTRTVTYNNVLDLVKTLAYEQGDPAKLAADVLRAMKLPALPYLVRILHHEDERLRDGAAQALTNFTGQKFGTKAEEWRKYVERVLEQNKEQIAKQEREEREKAEKRRAKEMREKEKEEEAREEEAREEKRKRTIVPLSKKDAEADLEEDTSENFEIKKRPGYVAPIDEE